jgi:hypothetical protein
LLPRPDSRSLLTHQAGQLACNLVELTDGLKRSTAEVVAGAAAVLINAAVRSVLGGKPVAFPEDAPTFLPNRYARPWQERDDEPWPFNSVRGDRQDLDDDDPWRRRMDDEEDPDYPDSSVEPDATPSRQRWSAALLATLQAAAWYLRSRPGRLPLAALGIGLAAGLAALVMGGITGPVAALVSLCELLFAGATLLRLA